MQPRNIMQAEQSLREAAAILALVLYVSQGGKDDIAWMWKDIIEAIGTASDRLKDAAHALSD